MHGFQKALNPAKQGTKVAAHYLHVGGRRIPHDSPAPVSDEPVGDPKKAIGELCGNTFASRSQDGRLQGSRRISTRPSFPSSLDADAANVMRQAFGWDAVVQAVLFSMMSPGGSKNTASSRAKRIRRAQPQRPLGAHGQRGRDLDAGQMGISLVRRLDIAFHVTALTLVDADFGKAQLELLLKSRYLHPSGQIPAYEWNFGDVNPPVHAWSTIYTYLLDKAATR